MSKEDDILYELDAIKRELKKIEEEEQKMLENQAILRNATQAVLAEQTRVEQRLTRMKYSDITTWRSAIWENCQYRETKPGDVMITYFCKKLSAPCRFEDCPLNHY